MYGREGDDRLRAHLKLKTKLVGRRRNRIPPYESFQITGHRVKTSDVDLLGDRATDPRPRLFADRFPNATHFVTVSLEPPPI